MNKVLYILASHKRKILISLLIVLVVGLIVLTLEKSNVINLYSTKAPTDDESAQTTSTAETAQDDFTGGNDREPGNSLRENKGTVEVTDNNGNLAATIDTSNPIKSKSGEISVYSPKANSMTAPEIVLTGTSSLPIVSYRLIDDISGVISTGSLNVVNGKFSGTVSFNTTASEGRLDIFGTQADGVEYSNIEIPLRFK